MLSTIKSKIKKNLFLFPIIQGVRFFVNKTIRPKFLYLFLNSKKPISNTYGLDRGLPIDRYYIEKFLSNNQELIKGECLELLDNSYTKKFGGDRVVNSNILDIDKSNIKATLYGDIKNLHEVPSDKYDCIILTQVLQFIDDIPASIKECYRILKPGGAVLATVPSLSRVDCIGGIEGDYWRFTIASAKYLFKNSFSEDNLEINSYGNVLAATSFLMGFSSEEIGEKIEFNDKNFPCIVTVKAIK